jgi:hypothetical protein
MAMRGRMIPIGAALLAACGSGKPTNQTAPVAAPPPIVSTPSAPAEPSTPAPARAVAVRAAAIPDPILGDFDASREDCGRSSDARLTVTPDELRFHESIGTVRKVTPAGPETLSVEADYQGEGESWRSVRELRLGAGGSTLTVSGDGTRMVRVRCPEAAR